MKGNFVAKHMNTYNRASVEENKRQKWIDEQHARQINDWEEELVVDDREDER